MSGLSWGAIAVIGGFAVVAVMLTLARSNRGSLIAALARLLSPYPSVRRLLPVVDLLYPAWRQESGRPRARYPTEWRIRQLRRTAGPPFVVVGGVYLDLDLRPIAVSRLEDNEFYDLDAVSMACGGSAFHFGRALHRWCGVRSTLYTRLGKDEHFSNGLRAMMREEPWIRRTRPAESARSQCGVSVHLVQRENDFYTTFTHTGTLAALEWDPILADISRETKRGGVLYIAGYFRTGLHRNLARSLRDLPPKLLICLEHGRFKASANPAAARALAGAFQEGLVDVYICTPTELSELATSSSLLVDLSKGVGPALEYFAKQRKLPPITVVRGRAVSGGMAVAHVLVGDRVSEVSAQCQHDVAGVGSKGVFNAAFVHALVTGSPDDDVSGVVESAVRQALTVWAGPVREDHDVSRQ